LVHNRLNDVGLVEYKRDDISELDLSYAITIYKSQGSEFGAVIIPVWGIPQCGLWRERGSMARWRMWVCFGWMGLEV